MTPEKWFDMIGTPRKLIPMSAFIMVVARESGRLY